ncbi:MAG: DNA-binding protein WhiA [Synergistaceae bacterium]|nr:DNA-binding protein WhiA [Synergistaceae bacterium]
MEKLNSLIWDEWLSFNPENSDSAKMELAGILLSMIRFSSIKKELKSIASSRIIVFNRIRRLWDLANVERYVDLASSLRIPRNKKGKIEIALNRDLIFLVESIFESLRANKNYWHWMRGVWGASGSFFKPRNGYYLLIRLPIPNKQIAIVMELLNKSNISYSHRDRLGATEISLRSRESIITFLHGMGLTKTTLALEQEASIRSMKNVANKLVNCDSFNIKRTITAARKQLELAAKAEELCLVDSMPQPLRDLIQTRLDNPSATMRELGLLLSDSVGKSTVEYRWKKIESIVSEVEREGVYNVFRKV